MLQPRVSVIIPSYNRFKFLLNAVDSVLNQTYENFEILKLMMDLPKMNIMSTNLVIR